jgi:hypothetical protein
MSTIANSAPISVAALWARRLLGGLAVHFPLLAIAMLWGELYLHGGGLRDLFLPRRLLGLFLPCID